MYEYRSNTKNKNKRENKLNFNIQLLKHSFI